MPKKESHDVAIEPIQAMDDPDILGKAINVDLLISSRKCTILELSG